MGRKDPQLGGTYQFSFHRIIKFRRFSLYKTALTTKIYLYQRKAQRVKIPQLNLEIFPHLFRSPRAAIERAKKVLNRNHNLIAADMTTKPKSENGVPKWPYLNKSIGGVAKKPSRLPLCADFL